MAGAFVGAPGAPGIQTMTQGAASSTKYPIIPDCNAACACIADNMCCCCGDLGACMSDLLNCMADCLGVVCECLSACG